MYSVNHRAVYAHEKRNLHYFLEEDTQTNKSIKEKNDPKHKSCLNLGNLEEVKFKYEVEERRILFFFSLLEALCLITIKAVGFASIKNIKTSTI